MPKHFDRSYGLFHEIQFSFACAGPILGSAFVRITYQHKSILFSGDLGRPQDEVMRAPTIIDEVDYIVVESTYGNRLHSTAAAQAFCACRLSINFRLVEPLQKSGKKIIYYSW